MKIGQSKWMGKPMGKQQSFNKRSKKARNSAKSKIGKEGNTEGKM